MPGSRRLLAAGGPGLTRRARTAGTHARLHDTIICRNRLRRLVPICRHARHFMTRYLRRNRLRRPAGFCRYQGSPPH